MNLLNLCRFSSRWIIWSGRRLTILQASLDELREGFAGAFLCRLAICRIYSRVEPDEQYEFWTATCLLLSS
jgi:hypothetical protein